MIVEILKTDKRLGIKKGQWWIAKSYELDPMDKVSLLERIRKRDLHRMKIEGQCTQYRSEVKVLHY